MRTMITCGALFQACAAHHPAYDCSHHSMDAAPNIQSTFEYYHFAADAQDSTSPHYCTVVMQYPDDNCIATVMITAMQLSSRYCVYRDGAALELSLPATAPKCCNLVWPPPAHARSIVRRDAGHTGGGGGNEECSFCISLVPPFMPPWTVREKVSRPHGGIPGARARTGSAQRELTNTAVGHNYPSSKLHTTPGSPGGHRRTKQ
jgi:hypothetical protein